MNVAGFWDPILNVRQGQGVEVVGRYVRIICENSSSYLIEENTICGAPPGFACRHGCGGGEDQISFRCIRLKPVQTGWQVLGLVFVTDLHGAVFTVLLAVGVVAFHVVPLEVEMDDIPH